MGEKQIVYDRTPDMKIKLEDGRVVTLGELESMVMEAREAVRLRAVVDVEESEIDTDTGFDIG